MDSSEHVSSTKDPRNARYRRTGNALLVLVRIGSSLMWYYVSLAARAARRAPLPVLLTIVTLAVGLAAGMTTNTLRYVLSRDPIPEKSARLLNLRIPGPFHETGAFDYATASALSRIGARYADAAVTGWAVPGSGSLPGQSRVIPLYRTLRYITANFFHMFDVPVARGRIWTPNESKSGAPVVVLSELWANKLFPMGRAVGKRVRLGGRVYSVIGVAGKWNPRPRYYNLAGSYGAFGDVGVGAFAPVTAVENASDALPIKGACSKRPPAQRLSPGCPWLAVWYLARAMRDVAPLREAIVAQLPKFVPREKVGKYRLLNVRQILAKAELVPGSVNLYAVLGAAFLALSILNAAGMQLSRVLRSRAWIGVRRALGASRFDIVKQYLSDALLMGSIGGGLGVGLTFASLYVVRANLDTNYADMVRMDGTMLGLLIVLVFVSSGLVGVVPAWLASRADPALVIKAAQ